MNRLNNFTFLGTGTSTGVPMGGCTCAICQSQDPKNKRFRSALKLQFSDQVVIIDTGPDLRTQLLENKVNRIDFVILTHDHADHCHGIDDLRPYGFFPRPHPIEIYVPAITAERLTKRFDYIFAPYEKALGGGIPRLQLCPLEVGDSFSKCSINGIDFEFCLLPHGTGHSLGIVCQGLAYLIDCHEISDEVLTHLNSLQLEYLVIDCVRRKPHETHLHLEKALSYVAKINAKSSYLTHLSHEFDHNSLQLELNSHHPQTFVAYDGLTLALKR